jgi:hypothetical protein
MLYSFNASAFQECLKCGLVFDHVVPIHTADQPILQTHTVLYCALACNEIKDVADNRRGLPEHLHKQCKCCGWRWIELTKDCGYKGNTIPFPPKPIRATVGNAQSLSAKLEALNNGKPIVV